MKRSSLFVIGAAALALSGCASYNQAPVDATRYHLDGPVLRVHLAGLPIKARDGRLVVGPRAANQLICTATTLLISRSTEHSHSSVAQTEKVKEATVPE